MVPLAGHAHGGLQFLELQVDGDLLAELFAVDVLQARRHEGLLGPAQALLRIEHQLVAFDRRAAPRPRWRCPPGR